MGTNPSILGGCLLGLAVGDAMGVTVDGKTYGQICETYGPAGLLGYDLVNGFAEISSYTQVAAFTCNGLLLGIARGQTAPDACMRNITSALKEWAKVQHLPGAPGKRNCWLSHKKEMRQRRCLDARTLDALTREVTGSLEKPANQAVGPGSLSAALAVGLYFSPERMQVQQVGILGAQAVALTHGDPIAFLSGAALAYMMAGIVHDPDSSMQLHICHAAEAVMVQFGSQYPQAAQLQELLNKAIALAGKPEIAHWQAMEQLRCTTAAEVLAGAVYAILASGEDFDSAMIIAVNHSGKSAAVGALTGAMLGARLGEEALPEFYLECLACREILRELAADLDNSGPKGWRSRLFDDEWDRKYTHGLPSGI